MIPSPQSTAMTVQATCFPLTFLMRVLTRILGSGKVSAAGESGPTVCHDVTPNGHAVTKEGTSTESSRSWLCGQAPNRLHLARLNGIRPSGRWAFPRENPRRPYKRSSADDWLEEAGSVTDERLSDGLLGQVPAVDRMTPASRHSVV